MSEVKPQPVLYKGKKYASTLEARIAVFLESADARPMHELKQYNTGESVIYTPDFLARNAFIQGTNQRKYVWIEGKEALWSKNDEAKMNRFSGADRISAGIANSIEKPLFVMNGIPLGDSQASILQAVSEESVIAMDVLNEHWQPIGKAFDIFPFNSNLVTGEHGPLVPCVKAGGGLYLGSIFDADADVAKTISAYKKAREAHFELVREAANVPDGIYDFKVRQTQYDKGPRGRVKFSGRRLFMTGYSQDGEFPVNTRMHLIGSHPRQEIRDAYEWKFIDLCSSVGLKYDPSIMDENNEWFWNQLEGKTGRALIKVKHKSGKDILEVADFWPADGSRPKGNQGSAYWERING